MPGEEAEDDDDDEYGDIDWCDAGELCQAPRPREEAPPLGAAATSGGGGDGEVSPAADADSAGAGSTAGAYAGAGAASGAAETASPAGAVHSGSTSGAGDGSGGGEVSAAAQPSSGLAARAAAAAAAGACSSVPPPELEEMQRAQRQRARQLRREAVHRHQALALCFVARLRALSDACDSCLVQAVVLSRVPSLDAVLPGLDGRSAGCTRGGRSSSELGGRAALEGLLHEAVPGHGRCSAPAGPVPSLSSQLPPPAEERRCALLGVLLTGLGSRGALRMDEYVLLVVARCRAEGRPARVVMAAPWCLLQDMARSRDSRSSTSSSCMRQFNSDER